MSFIRKLAPIAAGALFTGMTVMSAVALDIATYPAPFVDGGVADVGIVIGAGAAATDTIAAVDVATNLQANLAGVSGGTSGGVVTGEGVNLATSNTKLYYGSYIDAARTTLTKTELPTVLADGTVEDDAGNSYDYTQSIYVGNSSLNFSNSGADIDDPTMYIDVATTALDPVYRYDLSLSKELNVSSSDVQGNTITIMGQDFTIGASSSSTILYLYGVGTGVTLNEGESTTVTVGGVEYTISVDGVSSSTVGMVTVNGVSKEVTEGSIYKYGDLEVYAKNVFYLSKETQVSSIELSLGSRRLKIENGKTVKYGSDDTTIKNTYATVTAGALTGYISAVKIYQAAEKSKYDHIGIGEDFVDRVFGTIKVSFKSVIPALDSAGRDTLMVDTDSSRNARVTFTDALYGTEATFTFAHDSDTSDSTVTPRLADSSNYTIHVVEGEAVKEDELVVVNSGDYGRILEFSSSAVGEISSTDYIEFTDALSGEIFKVYSTTAATSINNTMNIDGQTYYVSLDNSTTVDSNGVAYITWDSGAGYNSVGTATTVFPRIKLKNGEWMAFLAQTSISNNTAVYLPGEYAKSEDITAVTITNATTSAKVGGINWTFSGDTSNGILKGIDYNDDGTLDCNFTMTQGAGPAILLLEEYMYEGTAYLDAICIPTDTSGTTTLEVSVGTPIFESSTTHIPSLVSLTSDTYKQQAVDRYGTWIEYDATENDMVTLKYPNDQMYCDVYIAEEAAAITAGSGGGVVGGSLGSVTVTDAEITSVSGKNLVVVGGSAINSAAAKVLGFTYPTYGTSEEWITATGVKKDMAIIKMFDSPYAEGKVAMLIAGYEGKDTRAAAKALVAGTPAMSGESALLSTVSESAVTIVTPEPTV